MPALPRNVGVLRFHPRDRVRQLFHQFDGEGSTSGTWTAPPAMAPEIVPTPPALSLPWPIGALAVTP
jgi:hypothetical protein